jgi:hypothetical protein
MTKLLDADIYKPVKEWQSLTKEELWKAVIQEDMPFHKAIDKALREKNNGQKETAQAAWLARGELEAVRIKQWQSLSDEEIEELYGDCSIEYFRDIEDLLREING